MFRSFVILLLSLTLVACQSNSNKSQETNSKSPQKIDTNSGGLFSSIFSKRETNTIALPPDLIATSNDKVKQNHEQSQRDTEQQVLPEVIGAKIINQNNTRWLRVETSPQETWDTLADFWAVEQIDLVEYEPAAGIMETDWISNNTGEGGNLKTLFNRVVGKGVAFDKYKIRLEREGQEITNVYVSHRSTEKLASNNTSPAKVTQYEWVEKESDQEKVAQLLQVMVLLFSKSG